MTPTPEDADRTVAEALARLRTAAGARPRHAEFLELMIVHYAGGGAWDEAPAGTPKISPKIETLLDDDVYNLYRWRAAPDGQRRPLDYPGYIQKLDIKAARRKSAPKPVIDIRF